MFKEVFLKFKLTPITKEGGTLGSPISRVRWTAQEMSWTPASTTADWDGGAFALLLMLRIQTNTIHPVLKM